MFYVLTLDNPIADSGTTPKRVRLIGPFEDKATCYTWANASANTPPWDATAWYVVDLDDPDPTIRAEAP